MEVCVSKLLFPLFLLVVASARSVIAQPPSLNVTALNTLIQNLESNGWDSNGDGTGDKGILDVLDVPATDPLHPELAAELQAAGLQMNDEKKKCLKGALEGLKSARDGEVTGQDSSGNDVRTPGIGVGAGSDPSDPDNPLDADCSPDEVETKDGVTSQKHTAAKKGTKQRIRITAKGNAKLGDSSKFMGAVLMHEGKRTCQVLSIANTSVLSPAEAAQKKELDCEAVETQILVWIALKMVSKDRSVPPPAQQPRNHRFACAMLDDANKKKKKMQSGQ
jgi:hypothetical protein